tara:strand:+ start:1067 stop:1933 length:867 start_codon:yes stop_codon:yes gene_type:complete
MPELPEVEVVKRSLEKKIQNLIIKKVIINDGNLRYKIDKDKITKIVGRKIKKIVRRSKFLIFKLDKGQAMMVHLGMTGKFFLVDQKEKKFKTSFYYKIEKNDEKYNRVIFVFKNKQKLIYNDVRKFGFIKFYDPLKYEENIHFRNLGPEPLSKDLNFNYLKNYLRGRNRNIKNVLMDQKCISGLGNIYVNEVLFLSGIRPTRKVSKLKDAELKKLLKYIKNVLKSSIKLGGSSIKDFSSDDGKKGIFQQYFRVYGKKGEKCSNTDCNTNLKRVVISNRSTFFCKTCQK